LAFYCGHTALHITDKYKYDESMDVTI